MTNDTHDLKLKIDSFNLPLCFRCEVKRAKYRETTCEVFINRASYQFFFLPILEKLADTFAGENNSKQACIYTD